MGPAGRITVEDTVRRYTFQQSGSETGEVWAAGYFNDRDREFYRTFDAYIDALLTAFKEGQPPPCPRRSGAAGHWRWRMPPLSRLRLGGG